VPGVVGPPPVADGTVAELLGAGLDPAAEDATALDDGAAAVGPGEAGGWPAPLAELAPQAAANAIDTTAAAARGTRRAMVIEPPA